MRYLIVVVQCMWLLAVYRNTINNAKNNPTPTKNSITDKWSKGKRKFVVSQMQKKEFRPDTISV